MSHSDITHKEYEKLNTEFGHASTQFYAHERVTVSHYRESHNDLLPNTPFWKYLEYRHDIDPIRFDHYHPLMGRWIEQYEKIIGSCPAVLMPPVVIPVIPPPVGSPYRVASVPEPSSAVLLSIAVICGAVFVVATRWLAKKRIEF